MGRAVGMNFYDAWWFLHEHPAFNHLKDGKPDVLPGFMCSMSVYVVLVNPETDAIDDDKKLNTATRIWLEAGPWGLPADFDAKDQPYAEICGHDGFAQREGFDPSCWAAGSPAQ